MITKPISHFQVPLNLRYIDGRNWLLTNPFTFGSAILERVIEVPDGFTTDFASIPRILWNIYPPTGVYGKPAVIHDFLYRTAYYATRAQADAVLLEAMIELGVSKWTREIIYRGVRIGGQRSYKGYAAIRILTLGQVDLMTRQLDSRPS